MTIPKFGSLYMAEDYIDDLFEQYERDLEEYRAAAVAYAEDVRDAAINIANEEFERAKFKILNEDGKVFRR